MNITAEEFHLEERKAQINQGTNPSSHVRTDPLESVLKDCGDNYRQLDGV